MERIYGKSVYAGIIIGKPYFKGQKSLEIESFSISDENIEKEVTRYNEAVKDAKEKLTQLIADLKGKVSSKELQILAVHCMMLDDPMFKDEIEAAIRKKKINVEEIIKTTVVRYSEMFKKMKNHLYQQRVLDVQDIGERLLESLADNDHLYDELHGKILIAKEVLPSELLTMFNKKIDIRGLVMEYVGETSHTAILAKSLEIPTFMGGKDLLERTWGNEIILDTYSERPVIVTNPSPETLEEYRVMELAFEKEQEEIEKTKHLPSVTLDGTKIELEINAGQELGRNIHYDVKPDGVGLFRTEFMYMKREELPNEDEQMMFYKEVSDWLEDDKPITIRTLDIGADKSLPYLKMEAEQNPSLGERGIRFTLNRIDILKTQLRAILRASEQKNIRIMHPMVSSIKEIKEVNHLMEEVKQELLTEGKKFNQNIKTGIMVEVPSAVFMSDAMSKYIDFFSIGSNDLAQYILATDRFSQVENNIYDYYDPAVVRAISFIAESAIKNHTEVSVCGEMAGDLFGIVVLLSLGIRTLSMSGVFLPRAKNLVRKINVADLEEIKKEILKCENSVEIKKIVREYIKKL